MNRNPSLALVNCLRENRSRGGDCRALGKRRLRGWAIARSVSFPHSNLTLVRTDNTHQILVDSCIPSNNAPALWNGTPAIQIRHEKRG